MQTETASIANDFLPIVLNFQDVLEEISNDEFENLCRHNPDLQIELTEEGELVIMPPAGGQTGIRNFSLIVEFGNWAERNKGGVAFDSSTVFNLPNGAKRSPDLAWVRKERWEKLTDEEQEKFPPICPDFLVELRSPSDSLKNLQYKMTEYIENEASLGWVIDRIEKSVHVYWANGEIEILENPEIVSGEPLLENFSLKMEKIWS
ncbi:MAG TPA: Uma2 family endonuclease [Pyrinomonadaceae bacterium]|jgi:Uma2 family endonuclease